MGYLTRNHALLRLRAMLDIYEERMFKAEMVLDEGKYKTLKRAFDKRVKALKYLEEGEPYKTWTEFCTKMKIKSY